MGRRKKGKCVKNNQHIGLEEPEHLKRAPHSFVIHRGVIGKSLRALVRDFRKVMEPFTASRLKVRKKNSLKDFVAVSGMLHVSHLAMFTVTDISPYIRVARLPQGPTLTFRVHDYVLARDVVSAQRKQYTHSKAFTESPLLVMNGFTSDVNHLKLVTTTFQSMFPTINITKVKLNNVKRCVLLRYDAETKCIDFRQYIIRVAPTGISKGVKKIALGKIPNLSRYQDMSDFIHKQDLLSDMSDAEEETKDVILPQKMFTKGNLVNNASAVRLTEIGPRMKLQLVKIEGGLLNGEVMYHEYIKKTPEEIEDMKKQRREKMKLKEKRKREQELNVKKKEQLKAEMKKKSLEGMAVKKEKIKEETESEVKTEEDTDDEHELKTETPEEDEMQQSGDSGDNASGSEVDDEEDLEGSGGQEMLEDDSDVGEESEDDSEVEGESDGDMEDSGAEEMLDDSEAEEEKVSTIAKSSNKNGGPSGKKVKPTTDNEGSKEEFNADESDDIEDSDEISVGSSKEDDSEELVEEQEEEENNSSPVKRVASDTRLMKVPKLSLNSDSDSDKDLNEGEVDTKPSKSKKPVNKGDDDEVEDPGGEMVVEDDDDAEWYRKEVGKEPEPELFGGGGMKRRGSFGGRGGPWKRGRFTGRSRGFRGRGIGDRFGEERGRREDGGSGGFGRGSSRGRSGDRRGGFGRGREGFGDRRGGSRGRGGSGDRRGGFGGRGGFGRGRGSSGDRGGGRGFGRGRGGSGDRRGGFGRGRGGSGGFGGRGSSGDRRGGFGRGRGGSGGFGDRRGGGGFGDRRGFRGARGSRGGRGSFGSGRGGFHGPGRGKSRGTRVTDSVRHS